MIIALTICVWVAVTGWTLAWLFWKTLADEQQETERLHKLTVYQATFFSDQLNSQFLAEPNAVGSKMLN